MSGTESSKPQSNTPDFNQFEQEVLQYWDAEHIYQKSLEKNAGNEPFVFYDGPPFATGLPHYGHILASTVKDAIPRYQTMRGKFVRRRWGWDCHGLPIENIVEKKLGISGKRQIEELGVEKFNAECRASVLTFADDWGKMVHRMGRWVDFENSYKTMDTSYQESVWWALKQLWDKSLVYEDRRVLLYCPRCETPMSNFEIAMDNSYKDVTENSVYVQFRLQSGQRILDWMTDEKTFVLAWTTTPWTLPGNTALHVGPTLPYVIVEQGGAKYIVTKERLDLFSGEFTVLRELSAASLAGLTYEPLYPGVVTGATEPVREGDPAKAHRIYVDAFVATPEGTGVVHSAVMYGAEDFLAAKEHDLPRVPMLDHKGHYLHIVPEWLQGVFFKNAEKLVLQDLETRGLVFRILPFTHSYPHCWRCGTPLFYNALPSWLINIQKIKADLQKAGADIEWHPAHLKEGRFKNSVEQAPDWNISRNRFWATALPFWRCQDVQCGQVDCVGSIAELESRAINFAEVYGQRGVVGEAVDTIDLHKPYIDKVLLQCSKCPASMQRVPEVVDCWVESASMPFAELHYPFENAQSSSPEDFKNRFPADFVAEYIAQTRAWFYVMHVLGVGVFGRAPFKHVVTTGTILAEDGSKMSKSKNNFPDPWVLLEKYGVDAIRFYLMQSPVMAGDDLNFSEAGVKEVSQKVNMLLYNVWSFYRMYSTGALKAEDPVGVTHVLDVWVLARLRRMIAEVTVHMDAYNTMKACREIVEFISDLSTWYVRRSRDRIKAGGADGAQALRVLGYVLARTCQVLAPIAPFIADKIYRDVTGEVSVHLASWPESEQLDESLRQTERAEQDRILGQMELLREVVTLALSARKTAALSVRQPLRALAFSQKEGSPRLSVEHLAIIQAELNVKQVDDFESLLDVATRSEQVVRVDSLGAVSAVLLDTQLDDALRQEGYAREFERAIQDLRKKSGLSIGEEIILYYNIPSPDLVRILQEQVDTKKTFISGIEQSLEVEADNEIQIEIAEQPVWLGIVRKV